MVEHLTFNFNRTPSTAPIKSAIISDKALKTLRLRQNYALHRIALICTLRQNLFAVDLPQTDFTTGAKHLTSGNMPRKPTVTVTAATVRSAIDRCRTEGRAQDFKVEGQRGLWLRVSSSGVASWSLVYSVKGRSGVHSYGLGRLPDTTLKDAREMAGAWMPKIGQGIDPRDVLRQEHERKAAEKTAREAEAAAKAARITVAQAVEAFTLAKHKNRTAGDLHYIFGPNVIADYGTKALVDLTRADIEAIHDKVLARGSGRQADNVLAHVRSLLSWAMKKRHVKENVASRFERAVAHGEGIRDRKLAAHEVKALWLLLDRDDLGLALPMRTIIRLAILLGSRAGELAGMRRSELSADARFWSIPAERMKAKRPHILALPPAARSIILETLAEADAKVGAESDEPADKKQHLFAMKNGKPPRSTSLSHAMAKLQAHLSFQDAEGNPSACKMHDLRRTVGTGLQHLGVPMDVVKAILAHSALDDVTRTHYAQSSLGREVHEALTRWQATVTAMVRGEDPFAIREEDFAEKERRILGQDQAVTAERAISPNVVPLRTAS